MPATRIVERFLGNDVPCDAVVGIGHSLRRVAEPGLSLHAHECHEVCLITHGAPRWQLAGRDYELQPGDVFLARPGEVHGHVSGVFEPCELRWIQIDTRRVDRKVQLSRRAALLRSATWPGDERLVHLLDAMLDECHHPSPDSDRVIAATLRLFIELLFRSSQRISEKQSHPAVEVVTQMIASEPQYPWSLDELTEASGIGRTQLEQLFKTSLGVSPIAYAMRMRLRCAQQLLRESGTSITRIAYQLGFYSSQHFATTFRKHYGMTPSAYRKSPAT